MQILARFPQCPTFFLAALAKATEAGNKLGYKKMRQKSEFRVTLVPPIKTYTTTIVSDGAAKLACKNICKNKKHLLGKTFIFHKKCFHVYPGMNNVCICRPWIHYNEAPDHF